MTRGRNLIPYGPLYLLREKGQYTSFTLGTDPEFVFTLFACVGLNAAKIHRAINRRVSVQMSSPHFKNPVDGEPEWISLSNQLMKEYHMTKAAKYREVVILLELGFLEEYDRESYNQSRIVRINPNVWSFRNICSEPQTQERVHRAALIMRKRKRPIKEVEGDVEYTKKFNSETDDYEVVQTKCLKTGRSWKHK